MTDGTAALDRAPAQDDDLHCYRHPDRVTRISCGRCERPICTKCAMQGPVGFRCRQCGQLAFDPIRSVTPVQAAIAGVISVGGGAVTGFISAQLGYFTIFVSFIAGGLIGEAVMRAIGIKRGPVIVGLVLGGIVGGVLLGYLLAYAFLFGSAAAEVGQALTTSG